ncbi:MAG TPA: hypothetical protein VMM54_14450 [Nitrospirota bacterium]|nr:hypothetical protein [Nitrospirota bacterium]
MKLHARRKAFIGLLLMVIALLATACASDGTYYQSQVGVYEYGYYGAYDPGYYRGDVIVGAPRPPVGVTPAPPHAAQMPARPLPSPAPRPMPARR